MKKSRFRLFAIYMLIVLTLTFILFPVFWIFVMSIKPEAEHFIMPPRLMFTPTFDNYFEVMFGGAYIWQTGWGEAATARASGAVTLQTGLRVLVNTSIVASLTAIFSVLLAVPAAYGFSRLRFRRSGDIQFYILAQRMAPPIAIIVPLFTLLRWAGLNNTYWGIVVTHLNLSVPLAVWLMKGFVDDVPREIDESAQIDGCSTLGIIWRMIFPLAKPGITAVAILSFLFSWNEFLFVSTLSGRDTQTLTVFISTFITNVSVEWSKLATVIVISFIPTVILVLALQRYLVRGLTFGAVKG